MAAAGFAVVVVGGIALAVAAGLEPEEAGLFAAATDEGGVGELAELRFLFATIAPTAAPTTIAPTITAAAILMIPPEEEADAPLAGTMTAVLQAGQIVWQPTYLASDCTVCPQPVQGKEISLMWIDDGLWR